MLGLGGSLRFPHFSWVEAVEIDKKGESIPCYTLDWGPINEIAVGVPALPERYLALSEGAWAIRGNYGQAIAHYAQLALTESAKVSFFGMDTMMREVCYKTSQEAAFTAFRLLADCAYDPNTRYWNRSQERVILPYLLAWRFWQKQTGSGCISDLAKIPDLRKAIEHGVWRKDAGDIVEDFLGTISSIERAMEAPAIPVVPVEGPDCGALHVIEDIVTDDVVISSVGPAVMVNTTPKTDRWVWCGGGSVQVREDVVCVPLINPGRTPNAFPTEGSWFRVSSPKHPGCFGFFKVNPAP